MTDASNLEHAAKALQLSFARALADLPSTKLGEVAKHLSISRTLAWKILSVANSTDALASASQVPGPRGMKLFVDAACRQGIRSQLLEEAERAYTQFHEVAGRHSTSRPQMRSLVAGFSARSEIDIRHRKAATRANSYIWNMHSRITYTGLWVFDAGEPGRSRNKADAVMVSGPISLTTFRMSDSLIVNRVHPNAAAGPVVRPLVPEDALPDGLPVIRRFSSSPLPTLEFSRLIDGTEIHRLKPRSLGIAGEQTLLFGVRIAEAEFRRQPAPDPILSTFCRLLRPSDAVVLELFLDKSIYPVDLSVEGAVLDGMGGRIPSPHSTVDRMAIECQPHSFDSADNVPPTPGIPNHDEMRAFVLDKIGRSASDFRAVTMNIPFPPTPSIQTLFATLP